MKNFLIWPLEEQEEGAPGHGQGGKCFCFPKRLDQPIRTFQERRSPPSSRSVLLGTYYHGHSTSFYILLFSFFSNRVHEPYVIDRPRTQKTKKASHCIKCNQFLSFVSKVSFVICIKVFFFSLLLSLDILFDYIASVMCGFTHKFSIVDWLKLCSKNQSRFCAYIGCSYCDKMSAMETSGKQLYSYS